MHDSLRIAVWVGVAAATVAGVCLVYLLSQNSGSRNIALATGALLGALALLVVQTSELHYAAYRAALLAPIEIAATIHALVAHIDQVATRAGSSPKLPLEEWKKLTTAERAVIATKLSNEAWHDLRGHSSESRKWWKKILCSR